MNNPIVTAYLADNAAYIDEDSAASICQVPDADWPPVLAALGALNGGAGPGIDCAVAMTRETLDEFEDARSHHWSERGRRSEIDCGGRKAVPCLSG